jgi:hypothetical protein
MPSGEASINCFKSWSTKSNTISKLFSSYIICWIRIMFGWHNSFTKVISLKAVEGIPSSTFSILIFFMAIIFWVCFSMHL